MKTVQEFLFAMLYYSSRVIIIDRRSEMKGSEAKMLGFMEGADKRYIIPVYQRKYDWKLDNCRQL